MNDNRAIEHNDLGALTNNQQSKLNLFKIKTRIGNETYLREHPEVDCLISSFVSEVCKKRPNNVREFAAEYFTDPELKLKVQALVQKKESSLKQQPNDEME